jgi:DNA-binding response OmpR family regulator
MQKILVVEDQIELSDTLRSVLTFEGFEVFTARDGESALDRLARDPIDLVVLDLMLPGVDGYQVITRLRQSGSSVGVLMLTARGEEGDRIRGLKLGADDYMVKPFSMLELLERIKAILRRTRPVADQPVFQSGPFRLESATMKATLDDQPLDLTAKQFMLLEMLLAHAGTTLDRSEILRHVWPPDSRPSLRAVDVHMTRLRRKLGDTDANGFIRSIASAGYRWTLPVTRL